MWFRQQVQDKTVDDKAVNLRMWEHRNDPDLGRPRFN